MTYKELVGTIKRSKEVVVEHTLSKGSSKACKSCNTNLDYFSKIVDVAVNYQVVKCLRCGSITRINF